MQILKSQKGFLAQKPRRLVSKFNEWISKSVKLVFCNDKCSLGNDDWFSALLNLTHYSKTPNSNCKTFDSHEKKISPRKTIDSQFPTCGIKVTCVQKSPVNREVCILLPFKFSKQVSQFQPNQCINNWTP